ncbi:Glutathione synthetase [hydrothermal vent metagenome]|uniref:Glutathione synthetase n=1 Tax=hydrothermal vent metagenome TaxID=652676 RepID=A0A3B0YPX8_9ZZZZ
MALNIGIIMDPVQSITPYKDSTLAMMLAAQKKGWTLHYIKQGGLYLEGASVKVDFQPIRVFDDNQHWFELGEPATLEGAELDVILMRIDPPFDMEYIYTTYLLEMIEQQGCLVVNKPSSLRDANEKLFATQFPQCCTQTLVTRSPQKLRAFVNLHKDVILKPLDGMGGQSIFRVTPQDANLSVILETMVNFGEHTIMAQKFIPEISAGDKRILMIDGRAVPFTLARIPAKGETRGNLAAGGSGVAMPITEREQWIADQVADRLQEMGILFAGLDVIGDYLTEINVTSPTCIRELDAQFKLDIAGDLMNCIENIRCPA